jgi:hypothetical protein
MSSDDEEVLLVSEEEEGAARGAYEEDIVEASLPTPYKAGGGGGGGGGASGGAKRKRGAAAPQSAAERQAQKAARQQERETAKEQVKSGKELAKVSDKSSAGRFRGAEMGLAMSAGLAGSEMGRQLAAAARALTASAEEEGGGGAGSGGGGSSSSDSALAALTAVHLLPASLALEVAPDAPSLHWYRGVVRAAVGGGAGGFGGGGFGGGGAAAAAAAAPPPGSLVFPVPTILKSIKVPLEADFTRAAREAHCAVLLSGEAWVGLVMRLGAAGVLARLGAWRAALPPGTKLQVILFALSGAVKRRLEAARGSGGGVNAAGLTQDALQALHAHIHIAGGIDVGVYDSAPAAAAHVLRLTRAIGEEPYLPPPSALALLGKAKGESVWVMMLQNIQGVSLKVATAIAARYACCRDLMDAYSAPGVSAKEASALLEGVMLGGEEEGGGGGEGAKKGRRLVKISQDVHRFFTTLNGEEEIEVGAKK